MATNVEVLADYRDQKKKLEALATAARKQMQARFTELLVEAAGIQNEFKSSFGKNPDVPAAVKTFTVTDKKKPEATPAEQNGKKVGGLRRSLAAAIKNGETARIAEVSAQLAALGVEVAAPEQPETAAPEADPVEDGIGVPPEPEDGLDEAF